MAAHASSATRHLLPGTPFVQGYHSLGEFHQTLAMAMAAMPAMHCDACGAACHATPAVGEAEIEIPGMGEPIPFGNLT